MQVMRHRVGAQLLHTQSDAYTFYFTGNVPICTLKFYANSVIATSLAVQSDPTHTSLDLAVVYAPDQSQFAAATRINLLAVFCRTICAT
jgi:hypothetical protein